MKIVERHHIFEIQDDAGSVVKQFYFDDVPNRRTISGQVNRKRALQEAKDLRRQGPYGSSRQVMIGDQGFCQICRLRNVTGDVVPP